MSETGLFVSVKENNPHPALIPYSVNAPLWSDGADKDASSPCPDRGHRVRHQSRLELQRRRRPGEDLLAAAVGRQGPGQPSPAASRARLLTRQQGQWAGYSYIWNDEQTEAERVPAEGCERVFEVHDPRLRTVRKQPGTIQNRVECMVCHSRAANWVLGLTELQMNKVHAYAAGPANQLRTLEHLGIFRVSGKTPSARPRAVRDGNS